MANKVISMLLLAKDAASAGIDSATNSLKRLDATAQKASGGLGGLAAIGGAAGFMVLTKQLGDLAQAGSQLDRLRVSFETLTNDVGADSASMITAITRATGGAISEYDTILSANRAMLLEVADTTEEMVGLAELAVARGRAMGISTEQAFNDIVTGLGRMSPLILDNLGIVINAEKVMKDYAESIGKAADDLTDAEKKQALLNATLANSASLIESSKAGLYDTANAYERLGSSVENFKRVFGAAAGDAIMSEAASVGASRIDLYTLALKRFGKESEEQLPLMRQQLLIVNSVLESMPERIDAAGNALERAFLRSEAATMRATKANLEYEIRIKEGSLAAGEMLKEQMAAYNRVRGAIDDAAASAGSAGRTLFETATEAANAGDKFGYLGSMAISASSDVDMLATSVANLKSKLAGVEAQFSQVNRLRDSAGNKLLQTALEASKYVGNDKALEIYEKQAAALWDQSSALKVGNLTTNEQIFAMNALGEETIAPLQNIIDAAEELETMSKTQDKVSAGAASISKEYSKLTSIVSGVLGRAIEEGTAGQDPSDFLPREQSVSENARRLADIMVNGFKGQDWLGEFKAEVPGIFKELEESGDPRGTAARILKDFQDGLRPELLNKDRAKELVKHALIGDQKTKALVDEISAELAKEMGISLGTVQEAATKALGGGGSGGGSASEKEMKFNTVVDTTALDAAKALIASPDSGWSVVVVPEIDVSAIDYANARTYIQESLGISLSASIDPAKTNTTLAAQLIVSQMNPLLQLTPHLVTTGMNFDSIRTKIVEALPLMLTPFIETDKMNLEAPKTYITEALSVHIVPWINTNLANIDEARTFITESMPLVLTPFINTDSEQISSARTKMTESFALSVTPFVAVDLAQLETAATTMTEGMPVIVTPMIKIDMQALKLRGLLMTDMLLSGMSVTEGIANVAQPILMAIGEQFGNEYESFSLLGASVSAGILSGVAGANLGLAIATTLSTSLSDNADSFINSGKSSGGKWGGGFLETVGENVPGELIRILADLVTPAVKANMNDDRGGAS